MDDKEAFADRLRDIFDVYDEDKDGYIAVDHVQKALTREQFGSAQPQEVTGIIHLLDPDGSGFISFSDFCEGVKQLAAIQAQAGQSPDTSLRVSCSLETLVPTENRSPDASLSVKCLADSDSRHTFAEYDVSALEENFCSSSSSNFKNQLALPTSEDEGDSAFSGKSSEISRQEVTDEENFEDYGESEADMSDPGLLSPGSARARRDRKDLLSRRQKRSWHQERDLYSPNSTRRSSFGSDSVYDIDGNFQNIDDRMKYLESQILKLSDSQANTHSTLKKENLTLKSKVHDLETQLHVMEVRTEDQLNEEKKKHHDFVSRQNREKTDLHMDYFTQRLQKFEEENEQLKQEVPRLRSEIYHIRTEKLNLQDEYDSLVEEQHKLQTEFNRSTQLWERERNSTGQLLDELGKELEDLRRYKIEHESMRKGSVGDLPARYQDLQAELHRLKEENKLLRDSNDDLNAQLLTSCMEEGRSLLRDTNGPSLADELEHLTKEENILDEDLRLKLLERLKKEQDINLRLKQYVDKIILTIIEKNPSLLEIAK